MASLSSVPGVEDHDGGAPQRRGQTGEGGIERGEAGAEVLRLVVHRDDDTDRLQRVLTGAHGALRS